jgi:AcrR family transcriptional regulator
MAKVQRNTSDLLLRSGLDLMSQEGLSGVTLGRLAESVGISKSGVFAHFASKEQVQLALLEYSTRFGASIVLEPAMRAPAGLPRLRAAIEAWFGWAPRAGLPGGCPIAAAMFELDDVEGPVRAKVLELEAAWRATLSELVSEAQRSGELCADLDVAQLVWELCGIYLSHHVSARFVRDPSADRRASIAVEALIARAKAGAS